nr:hypothetical protein [Streptomyces rishiriensis]
MVLLSAQGMPVARIAEVSFTSPDRVRDVIHNFNADGFRVFVSELLRRPGQDVHAARATGDQEDRQVQADRARPAVLDLEPDQARGLPGRRRGGRRHQPRGPAHPAPRGRRLLPTREDLEDLPCPGLRSQEGPHRTPPRDRRRRGHTRGRRARRRLLQEPLRDRWRLYALTPAA